MQNVSSSFLPINYLQAICALMQQFGSNAQLFQRKSMASVLVMIVVA
jgi:hypothetical protein